MSMISAQCDELRERAAVLRQGRWSDGADDARMMEDAADTIWQLRDDLQRANAENAKLRELVADYFNAPCVECNPWDEGWQGCKHCDSGNCNLAVRALKLGAEVDDG